VQEQAEQVDQAEPHGPRLIVGEFFSGMLAMESLQFVNVVLQQWHVPKRRGRRLWTSMGNERA